tara:strand:+ start:382 stop:621 length:240 start_codon:yes stop_codon:yes gene_type:complete
MGRRRRNPTHAHINRSYNRGIRKFNIPSKKQSVHCELYEPRTGEFLGYWNGGEQLFGDCECPCPNSGACLPGCCDLHDY